MHKIQDGYVVYVGEWQQGKIIKGQKIKYKSLNLKIQIETYAGQFKEMKYNGNGIRKYKNLKGKE